MNKNIILLFLSIVLISACTKVGDVPGKLVIKMTDDPFNISYVQSATVTITKIDIRKAGETDENKFITVSDDTIKLDLLKLRNGITSQLPEINLPQGSYDLIRLYVSSAGLKLKDRQDGFNVKVPGGQQTGIKIFIKPFLRVEGGLTSELLLDFDLSNSFIMRGNLAHLSGVNGFIFKPCIRAVNNSTAGRIEGRVTDTLKIRIAEAKVWVKKDTVLATAFTDTLGHYAIIGIPAGTYSVFATKENYDTVSYAGIKVVEANGTLVNFTLIKR